MMLVEAVPANNSIHVIYTRSRTVSFLGVRQSPIVVLFERGASHYREVLDFLRELEKTQIEPVSEFVTCFPYGDEVREAEALVQCNTDRV